MPKFRPVVVLPIVVTVVSVSALLFVLRDRPRIVSRGMTEAGSYIDLVSSSYSLDQRYMSMQGPRGNHAQVRLDDGAGSEETIWITGIETINVNAESGTTESNEFFCHSNLTFCPESITPEAHNNGFSVPRHMDWRLFTLVPGRMDVELPEGFGIPVRGTTELDYFTMALNQNPVANRRIRMRTRIRYQRGEKSEHLRPLFRRAMYVYQQHVESKDIAAIDHDGHADHHQGEDCAETCDLDLASRSPSTFSALFADKELDHHPGAKCCVVNASQNGITDQFGAKNTVHWMVPPGDHQYRTDVTRQLQLPFDTTVHYVTGHLHPFGISLTLTDLDRGETIFEITTDDYQDRLGVERMTELESRPGIPIHRDGRYELVARYNNTTSANIDAMGILYVYALDEASGGSVDSGAQCDRAEVQLKPSS